MERLISIIQMDKIYPFLFLCLLGTTLFAQTKTAPSDFVLARLKYYCGGDWYNDPSSIPNLLQFMADNSNIPVGSPSKSRGVSDYTRQTLRTRSSSPENSRATPENQSSASKIHPAASGKDSASAKNGKKAPGNGLSAAGSDRAANPIQF